MKLIDHLFHFIQHHRYRNIFLILVSSIMTCLSFAPWKIWPFGFLCMIPVFYLFDKIDLKKTSVYRVIGLGLLQGFFITLFSYHWIIHTMVVFGHLPYIAAFSIFILYSLASNLRWVYLFLFLFYFRKWKSKIKVKNRLEKVLTNPYINMAAFWMISESLGWQLFPYYGINLVSGNLIFSQIVDVFGIFGSSMIWFIIGYSIYRMLIDKKFSTIGVSLFLICHLYGSIAFIYWSSEQETYPQKQIGIPQGNTPLGISKGISYKNQKQINVQNMFRLSQNIIRKAKENQSPLDLLIWPESAVPFMSYRNSQVLIEGIKDMQDESFFEMIMNDILVKHTDGQKKYYSNMLLIDPYGNIKADYQKIELLPFGEFLPLGEILPDQYKRAFAEVSNFQPGNEFKLFPSNIGPILPLICYEVILPSFVLEFYRDTNKRAKLIVNITNDAWFGKSIESSQHLELARLRSIEFRLPILRATNSGITTQFDILGRNFSETDIFTQAERIYPTAIPVKDQSTLYSTWGNTPVWIFLFFYLGLWSVYFLRLKIKNEPLFKGKSE